MYSFDSNIACTFGEAIDKVTTELSKEGFGVLTTINVKEVLKKKIDVDRRPYTILGACNPVLANQAIEFDPYIGLLLPCNVVVREEEDNSINVSFMDPVTVLGLVHAPGIEKLSNEVKQRLERVCAALSA
jgi:uncharacterized protein (DUF302 family)